MCNLENGEKILFLISLKTIPCCIDNEAMLAAKDVYASSECQAC